MPRCRPLTTYAQPFQPATTGRDARSDVDFGAGFGVARHRLAGVHLETVDASAQVGDQAKVCVVAVPGMPIADAPKANDPTRSRNATKLKQEHHVSRCCQR